MMTLKEIADLRLKELSLGAVEAATSVGVERGFVRDLVEGRKTTIRADKIPLLAKALRLDPVALARGEMIPSGSVIDTPLNEEERALIANYRRIPGKHRSLVRDMAENLSDLPNVERSQTDPSSDPD